MIVETVHQRVLRYLLDQCLLSEQYDQIGVRQLGAALKIGDLSYLKNVCMDLEPRYCSYQARGGGSIVLSPAGHERAVAELPPIAEPSAKKSERKQLGFKIPDGGLNVRPT
jgi:hypothetical protein